MPIPSSIRRALFEDGTGTALQVRSAEDEVRTAGLRIVRARVDLAIAELGLFRLSGGLISRFVR